MFRATAIAIAALILASTGHAQTVLSAADEAAIRQSVLRLIDETNNNPMATLSEYVSNARVTSVNDETIVTGWNGLVEQTRQAQAGSFSMQTGTLDMVGMGPGHALVVAPFTMYWRTPNGTVSAPGSMTLAYERTLSGWKIVHEHYSTGLDDQTRQRLAQASSARSNVGSADLLRLLVAGLGGGYSALASQLLDMLAPAQCSR
jgi:hypothetical protein